jgi:nitric oxide reductase NorE protein
MDKVIMDGNGGVLVRKHIPGEAGIWIVIGGDLAVFGVFFVTYLVSRAQELPLFLAGQGNLIRGLGLLNTILLLTSSWCVARAVHDSRKGGKAAPRLLGFAIACGLGFCAIKAVEYSIKIMAGFTMNTNLFWTFYYMFTGIHLVHLLVGLGFLLFLRQSAVKRAAAGGEAPPGHIMWMESGGAFWHMVDLLWIVLFALLYLIR